MTRLRVLGTLEVVESERVGGPGAGPALRSARLRRLLAGLVLRANSVASVDWLADVVWGEEPPTKVESAMHTLVSRLRSTLRATQGSPHSSAAEQSVGILTRAPGYVLQAGVGDLDASLFEQLATSARHRLEQDPATAAARLDEALALWRGPAYAEFADDDFARPEAARLEELRAQAGEDRIEAALQLGQHHDVTARLEALTSAAPLRERPHSQLMLARYRAGRQADALSVFHDYRLRLDDELGLEPSPTMQQLHTDILRQAGSLEWRPPRQRTSSSPGSIEPATGASLARADRSKGNLPASPRTLVGREADLASLGAALAPGTVTTLTGPGGVGKTSLAIRAADDVARLFDGGVWLSELATLSDPAEVAPAVITALGVPARQGADALERLVEYASTKRLLLVIDNCEHLLEPAATLVDAIHRACPDVAVLATSRAPLDIADEHVWAVAPLPVPNTSARSQVDIAESPSVQLFVSRASSQSRDFALADDNAVAVSEICRRLDGLPLALELAATRMRSMSPDDLVARLSWRFRLLHGGPRTTAERHRTLDALVDWSYELLAASEQQVFEVLSVFAGSFTLAAAEQLVAAVAKDQGEGVLDERDVADIVSTLVDNSMLVRLAGAFSQYTMLETLRTFGRHRLKARPYAADARRAHAELFAELANSTVPHLFGPRHISCVDQLGRNLDELRSAYTWALDNDLAIAATLVGGMIPYVEHRMSAEVLHWALRVLQLVEDQGLSVPDLARVYAVAASGSRFVGAMGDATAYAEKGLAVSDSVAATCYLVYLQAEVDFFRGDFDAAIRRSRQIAELLSTEESNSLVTWVEMADVLALAYTGHPREAAEAARDLQRKAERSDEDFIVAWAIYAQGEALIDADANAARPLIDRALELACASNNRYLTGVALVSAATVRSRHGDPAEAAMLFVDVIEHWQDAANWSFQWTTLRNVLDLLVRVGRFEQAAVLHGALENRSTATAAFGAEAQRTSAAAADLTTRLGADALAEFRGRGLAMSDDAAVAFAKEALRP